jgi:hypothetical protein
MRVREEDDLDFCELCGQIIPEGRDGEPSKHIASKHKAVEKDNSKQ